MNLRRTATGVLLLAAAAAVAIVVVGRLRPPRITVGALEGRVERRSGSGPWSPAHPGEVLGERDALRTGPRSEATLSFGDRSRIRIEEETDLSVAELRHELQRFHLGAGRIEATVTQREGRVVRIEAGAVAAEASGGRFGMTSNGAGVVALAVHDGSARFEGEGRSLQVRSGQMAVALPGEGPGEPEGIPESVFLKMDWPRETRLNRARLLVAGTSAPGTLVHINGLFATVSPSGAFSREIPLEEGRNRIQVDVEDAAGRHTVAQSPPVLVDTRLPDIRLGGKAGWR